MRRIKALWRQLLNFCLHQLLMLRYGENHQDYLVIEVPLLPTEEINNYAEMYCDMDLKKLLRNAQCISIKNYNKGVERVLKLATHGQHL